MSGSSYHRFVELLKLWPVDKTKIGGRDLGEYIQHRISKTFVQGVATSVDEEKCSAIVSSLTRLAKDTHKNKFPRTRESSALGLTKEECSGLLSNEFLALLHDREKPFFNRFSNFPNKKT
ncbi:ubiquinol-cytochrome-c reductase complex assembly factor 2-like [Hyalella azteca]|uniref:Mitochondrial nucleoid factor 1 n=1 Tax=Hyalella azteca TaxID=294128 RepID=A0A979FU65_HYAAZ|nr:ubiquinol-cytochrome-c reductase complex assembly factor 2-like [Hyalella azteca]